MTILNHEVISSADESVLCWLATVDSLGQPNVSPKEIFAIYSDDELIIANIASPQSARNIKANPKVCVSFVHVLKQKGYKVTGQCEYLSRGSNGFAPRLSLLEKQTQGKFPVGGIFSIKVTSVRQIVAPSYSLFPDTTEKEQIASAIKSYGFKALDTK